MAGNFVTGNQKCIQPILLPRNNQKAFERLTSPLIIRPIKIGNKWKAGFFYLNSKKPEGYVLRKSNHDLKTDYLISIKSVFFDYPNPTSDDIPSKYLNPEKDGDIVHAFLNYANQRGLNTKKGQS